MPDKLNQVPQHEGPNLDLHAPEQHPLASKKSMWEMPPPDGNPNLQSTANNSAQVKQLKALQANANAGVIQRQKVFRHNGNDIKTKSGSKIADSAMCDSSANKMNFTKDASMPTPYKVIKDTYDNHSTNGKGNYVNGGLEAQTDTYDRPHLVETEIHKSDFDDREDPITTEIGTMGDDERYVREGKDESAYDGGHLMGAMILGKEAQYAYNIAPQELDSNRHSYNHTIEQAIRSLPSTAIINYKVRVEYDRNNYRVDQQTLKDREIIQAVDYTKPWNVVIPTRIPKYWKAEAVITSGHKFAPLNSETSRRSKGSVQDAKNANPDLNKEHGGGAFHLGGNGTSKLSFFLHQYTPVSTKLQDKPKEKEKLGTENSLENYNQYEKNLPSANKIKGELPGIAFNLKKEALLYQKEMVEHAGYKYLNGVLLPAKKFPVDDSYPQECVKTAEEKIKGIALKIPESRDQRNALLNIDLEEVFDEAYLERKEVWNGSYDHSMNQVQPHHSALTHLLRELEDIQKFGTNYAVLNNFKDKQLPELRAKFQEALDLKQRIESIKSESVNNRMNYFKMQCDSIFELCEDKAFYTKLFKDKFAALVDKEILFLVTSLPKKILRTLDLPDRELPNAKRNKVDYSNM